MDRLEHYLDQVCRSIGGPKALRQHVRQELREHLLDAAAGHRAAGLSAEAALDRALEGFGGPEEVRSGLEEAHGRRLLPVVIDRAMQWKERTMRAKWLWTTWAHLALAGVIVLALLWLTFANISLVPRFQLLVHVGLIDPAVFEDHGVSWLRSFLEDLSWVGGHYTTWLLLAALAAGVVFEWRVRGENKSLIRLSAWGAVALVLVAAGVLTGAALVIPYMLGVAAAGRLARPYAVQQVGSIETSVAALEKAAARKDWPSVEKEAREASAVLDRLAESAPAVGALARRHGEPSLEQVRGQLRSADERLTEARQAAREQDAARLETALRRFRELFGPIRRAAAGKAGG
jgi:hypothetical protein